MNALSPLAEGLAGGGRTTVQVVVAVVVVLLLCEREVARLAGGRRARAVVPALDAAIAPLAVVWALMLVVRLVELR